MNPSEVRRLRKTLYPVGDGIIMSFTSGQYIPSQKSTIHEIIEYVPHGGQSYVELILELNTGETCLWKRIFASGVVLEYNIDSLQL